MEINLPNNMSLDLTDDQVKELRKQLDNPEMPKTWDEAMKATPDRKYWVNNDSEINSGTGSYSILDYNSVCSQKQAKSVLAYTQLLVVVSALNGTVEMPDKDHFEPYYDKVIGGFDWCSSSNDQDSPFRLKTKDSARHLITHFSDLLNDFYMI